MTRPHDPRFRACIDDLGNMGPCFQTDAWFALPMIATALTRLLAE